jgi:hypothetical protein
MACKGKACFFLTDDMIAFLPTALVSNKRLLTVQNSSSCNFYIESRHLHYMPRNGTAGVAIAVKLHANLLCAGALVCYLLWLTADELYFFSGVGNQFHTFRKMSPGMTVPLTSNIQDHQDGGP